MIWKPNVTVAAVIEQHQQFLMVEEMTQGRRVYNQPAGHLEENETLLQAARREVLEETGWHVEPEYLLGIYRMHVAESDTTYLRFCFAGSTLGQDTSHTLDAGILAATWMSRAQLIENPNYLRSPLVMLCIDDYLSGKRYPLDLLHDLGSV